MFVIDFYQNTEFIYISVDLVRAVDVYNCRAFSCSR